MSRFIWLSCLITILLFSACSVPPSRLQALETSVEQLEAELAQIKSHDTVTGGSTNTSIEEQMALQARMGSLARRLAEIEYTQAEGAAHGLVSLDQALVACLEAIEQPLDLSYVIENVEFIARWKVVQPDSPAGSAWRFTIQGPQGRFIIAVDAASGHMLWVNQVNAEH